jgi:RNA polymerase sigma-70 factor, ECF subfamily
LPDRHGMMDGGGFPFEAYAMISDDRNAEHNSRDFVRLLAEHERRLASYIHTLVPVWQDAEDVLQNTKLRLWEQFESFEIGTDFAAWAFTIAGYMVRTHRKSHQRQRVCFNDAVLERIAHEVSAISGTEHDDRLSALVECVKKLSAANRRLLRLWCMQRRKIKDIAVELGQTPSATYSNLFRIRRVLLECARKRLQDEKTS